MRTCDRQSEPYSQFGNISATGIGRILGTPTHDRLGVVIRETVQNSWDARERRSGPLCFRIRLRDLEPYEVETLQTRVFADLPGEDASAGRLQGALESEPLTVLELCDFGTSGLGGPLRADVPYSGSESPDFVDFIRNVGSARDTEHGGGTYGYGKSSLYALSRCQSVVVHSLGRCDGADSERFIACRLGEPYASAEQRFTGRHWWGRAKADGLLDPLVGRDAASAAEALGLPARSDAVFGTTILIIDPDLEHRDRAQAIASIQETLLWFFWPKMVSGGRGKGIPMRFEVLLDGVEVPLPPLERTGPLGLCANARKAISDGSDADVYRIECQRPRQKLGTLAVKRGPVMPRPELDTGDEYSQFPPVSSHIALMRPAELVIRYLEGPRLPSDLIEYAGLFICDYEVEPAFAAAEPPAHDDWIPDNLTGRDKTFVRVALRRIREELKAAVIATTGAPGGSDPQPSLGGAADGLGALLAGQAGSGLSAGRTSPTTGARGNQKVTVSTPQHCGFDVIDEQACTLFEIHLKGSSDDAVTLLGHPGIVLEGGGTVEAPEGGKPPEIVGWYDMQDNFLGDGEKLVIKPSEVDSIIVAVSVPGDYQIAFRAELGVTE